MYRVGAGERRVRLRVWAALVGIPAIVVGVQLLLLESQVARATTQPTNSILVRVQLTSTGVKFTPQRGWPVAEARYVTLFRVYNDSPSARRFETLGQGVTVKSGKNSGFYVYYPNVANFTWHSTAVGHGKKFSGTYTVKPCRTIACKEQ